MLNRSIKRALTAAVMALTLSACTPAQAEQWLDRVGIDADPAAVAVLATHMWCHDDSAADRYVTTGLDPAALDGIPAPVCPPPPGWVDLGNGVYGPKAMTLIRACESGARDSNGQAIDWTFDYAAANRLSSARGAWQALTGTWQWVGEKWVPEILAYPSADQAPPALQDRFAVALYTESGPHHWNASRSCWG